MLLLLLLVPLLLPLIKFQRGVPILKIGHYLFLYVVRTVETSHRFDLGGRMVMDGERIEGN